MQQDINLSTLAGGAVDERFKDALTEVLQNILDPNTDAKTKRGLTLSLKITPDEDRQFAKIDFDVKTTLAPAKTITAAVIIDQDGRGKPVAAEILKQIPGQTYIDEAITPSKIIQMK
jgi:hypothetical protein